MNLPVFCLKNTEMLYRVINVIVGLIDMQIRQQNTTSFIVVQRLSAFFTGEIFNHYF